MKQESPARKKQYAVAAGVEIQQLLGDESGSLSLTVRIGVLLQPGELGFVPICGNIIFFARIRIF